MTTLLVTLALCLWWGLQIILALCKAAKREPVEFERGSAATPLVRATGIRPYRVQSPSLQFGVSEPMTGTIRPVGSGQSQQPRPTHAQ